MKYCKGCQKNLSENQFNREYRYCGVCYNSYKTRRNVKGRKAYSNYTCVYFIRSGDLIKIGYTSDLQNRKSSLQTNNPTKIEILKTIPGGYEVEQQLHHKFAHLNKQGEWFFAAQELLDFITSPNL